MKTFLKILSAVVIVLVVVVVGAYVWASMASSRTLSRVIASHTVDFPIPFPIDADDPDAATLDEAAREQLALARARERGRHLVESRYVCIECHGENFGGGVMVDAFPLGRLLGPNLTAGRGSRIIGYTPADWDRIVRHGIRRDGKPAVMPSDDFMLMSDQELSDVVAYVLSAPPVDNEVPEPSFGPLGKFLIATGELHLSADRIASHDESHREFPPPTEASVEFGRHIAGVCTGCHRPDLTGGPIVGGDPSWPPARSLTPHAAALGPWTYEQFVRAMREGVRPDGTALQAPMTLIAPYAQRMTDVEMEALWLYLRSLPPVAPSM